MSVLACDRRGCENVMCDRLSYQFGYICSSCYDELLDMGFVDIEEFMDTPTPKKGIFTTIAWESCLKDEFSIK